MDIVSRLKTFINYIKVPVTQFADNARIPRPSLSQLLNGRNRKVSDEVISKIHVAYPQLNMLWLLFGEGEMIVSVNHPTATSSSDNEISNPIIPKVQTNEKHTIQPDLDLSDSAIGIDFSDEYQKKDDSFKRDINDDIDNDDLLQNPTPHKTNNNINESGNYQRNMIDSSLGLIDRPDDDFNNEDKSTEHSQDHIDEQFRQLKTLKNKIHFQNSDSKSIVNIIIYYSDNSYESFIPEYSN